LCNDNIIDAISVLSEDPSLQTKKLEAESKAAATAQADELGVDPKNIDALIYQFPVCSRAKAVATLKVCNNNVLDAIGHLNEDPSMQAPTPTATSETRRTLSSQSSQSMPATWSTTSAPQASMKSGMMVKVQTAFQNLTWGTNGIVRSTNTDGAVNIDFQGVGTMWVDSSHLSRLQVVAEVPEDPWTCIYCGKKNNPRKIQCDECSGTKAIEVEIGSRWQTLDRNTLGGNVGACTVTGFDEVGDVQITFHNSGKATVTKKQDWYECFKFVDKAETKNGLSTGRCVMMTTGPDAGKQGCVAGFAEDGVKVTILGRGTKQVRSSELKAIQWGQFKLDDVVYYVGQGDNRIQFGQAVRVTGLWGGDSRLLAVEFGKIEPIGVPFEHLSHHEALDLNVIQIAKKGLMEKDVPAITQKYSNDLQLYIWKILPGGQSFLKFNPQVGICYATGQRVGKDVDGGGPGMLQAAVFLDEFHKAGVPMASGLQVETGGDWKVLLPKLGGKFGKCEALIILLTKSFYHSTNCLKEVNKAITCQYRKVRLFPIRCEEHLPDRAAQWPEILAGSEEETMLEEVQDVLEKKNSFPMRGLFFSDPDYMPDIIKQIKDHLQAEAT